MYVIELWIIREGERKVCGLSKCGDKKMMKIVWREKVTNDEVFWSSRE